MDCKSVKKLIPTLLDCELSDAKGKLMEEHLTECAECRREAEVLRSTMEALDVWPTSESRRTYADFKAKADIACRQKKPSLPICNPVPRWAAATMLLLGLLGGTLSGASHGLRNTAHTHQFTVQMTQASESLGLDAFNGGLQEALYEPTTGNKSVEVGK